MIKLAVRPENGIVAGGAERYREACRDVVRDIATIRRCVIPIFQVAPAVAAIRGREACGVVVPRVAIAALHHLAGWCQLMRAGQRKACRTVIKYRRSPRNRVVARRAVADSERRSSTRVHRIVCRVVGRQMALRVTAIGRLNRQRRIVAHVALVATRHLSGRCDLVRVRQRKTGVGMVECRVRPHDGVVTLRAKRRWEPRGNVVRHRSTKRWSAVPRRLVAPVAIRVRHCKRIVVAHVAVRAGIDLARRRQLVRARQCPTCRAVIEDRRSPGNCVVACRTIRSRKRRAGTRVRRIIRLLPGR